MMPTQEQIDKAIEECIWRRDMCGTSVCGGAVLPCTRAIERGQCDTLIKLFSEEKEDE